MGTLGLAPPHSGCKWEPLQPPLLWPWEPLRQKQEEKQLEGKGAGSKSSPLSKRRKFKLKPGVEEERGDG